MLSIVGLRLGTFRIPVAEQPEHRVAHGHLLGLLAFRRAWHLQRLGVKWTGVAVEGLAEEHILRGGRIVRRPAVVHQDACVVQVAGVHRGPRKVVANGLEVLFVPLMRHGVLLRQDARAPHHHEPHRPHRTLHPICSSPCVVQSQVHCNLQHSRALCTQGGICRHADVGGRADSNPDSVYRRFHAVDYMKALNDRQVVEVAVH